MKMQLAAVLAVVSLLLPAAGRAERPQSDARTGWRYSLGAGTLSAPAFLGSRDYYLLAVPDLKVEYKDRFFVSVKEGVGYAVIAADGWRVGPLLKYEFGRKENGSNPFRVAGQKSAALAGLGDVDATLELGGFAELRHAPYVYSVKLLQGLGGHKGVNGEAGITYTGTIGRSGPPLVYGFGPRLRFADAEYTDAYFGISQTQAARSGLTPYRAGGGLLTYGGGGFLSIPVTDPTSVAFFCGYERLGNAAADSPLVRERGSEDQFAVGVRVTYRFE